MPKKGLIHSMTQEPSSVNSEPAGQTVPRSASHGTALSTRTPAEREAKRRAALAQYPPSQGQLRYLTSLGYCGPVPASMLAASDLIEGLLGQGVQP